MRSFWQDLRYGLRLLARNPGFTAVAVLTLALGIGANTAIFSVVNAYLLRPLPFAQPNQLVHIWQTVPKQEYGDMRNVSTSNFLDWREQSRIFDQLGAYFYEHVNVVTSEEPIRILVSEVTPNVPALLGVQPILGRSFLLEEGQPGRNKVVLLSQTFWQRHFNSDPHVLEKTVRLDGVDYAVVGVMPASFVFPLKATQMWMPLALKPDESRRGETGPLLVIGRLKAGATILQAQAEMSTITKRLAEEYPKANRDIGAHVVPLRQALLFFYDVLDRLFLALLLATGFVLLIVCSNLGSLLLTRTVERSREVAIRTALGASRLRLIRQALTESALLAALGGALGALLAGWVAALLGPNMPEDLYRVGDVSVDGRVLGFTLGVALLAVFLFGLSPALLATRVQLTEALKEGGRGTGTGMRRRRAHDALVVAQIALATVLVAGAIFAVHAFVQQSHTNPGFNPSHVVTMELTLPPARYTDDARVVVFYREVLRRVSDLSGAESAAAVFPLPMNYELNMAEFQVPGKAPAPPEQKLLASNFWVTPDYFQTLQIPLMRGRAFNERDDLHSPPVVIINHLLAEREWPGADPVGRPIALLDDQGKSHLARIVGVVGDSKDFLMHEKLRPQIYLPALQAPRRRCFLVVRTRGNAVPLAASARSAVRAVDSQMPITSIRPMSQVVFEALGPVFFAAAILGVLGVGALLLAAMGIYGVVAYSVRQRTHEIGVRLALGAQKRQILELVLRQGSWLAGAGVGIGLAGVLGLAQVLRSVLAGSFSWDPLMWAGAPLLLAAVALLACYVPARRAAKVDPIVALRYE